MYNYLPGEWISNTTEKVTNQLQPINKQCSYHRKTSQLIYSANQLSGFHMMGKLAGNGLRRNQLLVFLKTFEKL